MSDAVIIDSGQSFPVFIGGAPGTGTEGPPGPPGEGAVGEIAATGTTGDGVADDRAALLSSNSSAAAAMLAVGGGTYRVASNLTFTTLVRLAKGAKLVPDAGVNVHFAEGYIAYDDWHWCFDVSAAGSSVTGDKAPMGYVTPQHFGADPTDPLIDDMPAIEAATEYATLNAIRFEYANGYPVKFPYPGDGNYYVTLTRPIYVARTTKWFSDTRAFGRTTPATEIKAADGLDAVVVIFFPGGDSAGAEYEPSNDPLDATPGIGKQYGGLKSVFENLAFLPETGATVRQGVVHNAIAYFRHCTANDFSECGFHAVGNASGSIANLICHPGAGSANVIEYDGGSPVKGSVNLSSYEHCIASDNGLHGFVAHGSVAGTIRYYNCDAQGNSGAGFLENTPVGCQYISCHSAQNCFDVDRGGVRYIPIKYHTSDAASEPGVGANWRNYWLENGSASGDVTWALATEYFPAGGINVSDATSQTSIVGCYTEGGIEVGVIGRDMTVIVGDYASVRAPWHGEFRGCKVIGGNTNGQQSVFPFLAQTTPGDASTDYGGSWGAIDLYTSGRIMQFGDGRDDSTNKSSAIRFSWINTRGRYDFADASNSSKAICGFTGTGYTGTGYSGLTESYFWANGMFLSIGPLGTTGNTVARLRNAANLAGITTGNHGAAIKGDYFFHSAYTTSDPFMSRVKTAGAYGSTAELEHVWPGPRITVGTSGHASPAVNDIWIDTN